MDAELGRNYSTSTHLNWVFTASSDARPGWGCEYGQWGNYDAYGLIGSTTDTSGYAFSMDTYTAAGIIAPVARYQPQYARLLGRWLLHVAANANLFYPDTLPTNMQSSAAWVQQTGVQSISYEGVRNLAVTTPYATGDATAHPGFESLWRLGKRLDGGAVSNLECAGHTANRLSGHGSLSATLLSDFPALQPVCRRGTSDHQCRRQRQSFV
jgi:hypothetical protein